MTIQEILEMVRQGQITPEAANAILDKMRSAVAGKIPAEDKDDFTSASDFMDALSTVMDEFRNTPEGQAQLRDTIAGRKEQRFVKRYTPFFNALLAGADIASSLQQVKQSKEALNSLRRPGLPVIPGIDPALDQAIRGAQVGTMDAARAIAPARQELQDQYGRDIALAKSVGGGQGSTLAALGQAASMRRARGAAGLAPMVDAIRAREQGRLDDLVGQRMRQANQNYYNRFQQARLNIDQYNQDALAAGQLGAVGRTNLRNATQSLLNQVPRVAARLSTGYQDRYDAYEDILNRNLLKVITPQQQPRFSESDIYGSQTPVSIQGGPTNTYYNPYE